MTALALATLLCSRLCHDLVSPIGAVNNGLELLDDDPDEETRREAQDLVRKSARHASAKLQFMRVAFGAAGSLAESVSLEEPRRLTEGLLADSGIALHWVGSETTLDKELVRLLMNFILIGYEALPRGGALRVGVRKEGAINLMISAEGPRAKLSAEAVKILETGGDPSQLEPRLANCRLAYLLGRKFDANIHCLIEADAIQIAVTI